MRQRMALDLIDPHLQFPSAGRNQIALGRLFPISGIQTGRFKVLRNTTAYISVFFTIFSLPSSWLDQAKLEAYRKLIAPELLAMSENHLKRISRKAS
jgi:hypothetical protein